MSGEYDLEKAVERAGAERGRLFGSDGSRVFSDSEHARREQAIDEQLEADLQGVIAGAHEGIEQTRAELRRLELPRDPVSLLVGEDLERAGALAPFIREEVESLAAGGLAGRVEAILADDDQVPTTLWARYLRQRVTSSPG